MAHLPTAGEIVLFDRSWYNRAGVEKVMGFCTGEQHTRFAIRQIDPVRQWKLSATDIALLGKWDEYTAAKIAIFRRTDTPEAPWTAVKSNDKKRARLEAMRSVLAGFEYEGKDHQAVGYPDPLIVGGPSNLRESGAGQLTPEPAS